MQGGKKIFINKFIKGIAFLGEIFYNRNGIFFWGLS
jgi:hypothetical protein